MRNKYLLYMKLLLALKASVQEMFSVLQKNETRTFIQN